MESSNKEGWNISLTTPSLGFVLSTPAPLFFSHMTPLDLQPFSENAKEKDREIEKPECAISVERGKHGSAKRREYVKALGLNSDTRISRKGIEG